MRRLVLLAVLAQACLGSLALAQGTTPIAGHYPPGQTGIRGAATPVAAGWTVTNFNRLFSNLEVKDAAGEPVREVTEARYANITMITWNTDLEILGMRFGMLAGVPFATGNLNPSTGDSDSTSLGLGDVLVTPLSLYGRRAQFDYQVQVTYWSSSGRFEPAGKNNRGAGFVSAVYSIGGVWYPHGDRDNWSVSAVSRFEQNFEQSGTGIHPGDDVVIDWGIGKRLKGAAQRLELGISGFATWQLTRQSGGPPDLDPSRYRYFGMGPEGSALLGAGWTLRVRAHWEFAARNAVQGNNLWMLFNYAF
jgi:hypothetical protein